MQPDMRPTVYFSWYRCNHCRAEYPNPDTVGDVCCPAICAACGDNRFNRISNADGEMPKFLEAP